MLWLTENTHRRKYYRVTLNVWLPCRIGRTSCYCGLVLLDVKNSSSEMAETENLEVRFKFYYVIGRIVICVSDMVLCIWVFDSYTESHCLRFACILCTIWWFVVCVSLLRIGSWLNSVGNIRVHNSTFLFKKKNEAKIKAAIGRNRAGELMRVGLIRRLNSVHTYHCLSSSYVNCSEHIVLYVV